jgi:hypothetical protein
MMMFNDTERMLLLALVIAGFVQAAKLCIPLLNGWGAVAANATLAVAGVLIVFGHGVTWGTLATVLLVSLAAAGIHGTATKVSDYPSPHENPTPSGTPAQNYKAHMQ